MNNLGKYNLVYISKGVCYWLYLRWTCSALRTLHYLFFPSTKIDLNHPEIKASQLMVNDVSSF